MSGGVGVLVVLWLWFAAPAGAVVAGGAEQFGQVQETLAQCRSAYVRLEDYRGTLLHEVGEVGAPPRQDTIEVEFRKPGLLRLRWQTGLYKGTTLLARPGWNDGNLLITLGGWFDFISVSASPTDVAEPFAPGLKDVSEWLTALVALAQRPHTDRSLRLLELQTRAPTLAEGKVLLSVPAFLIPFRDNSVAAYDFVIERGTGIPVELVLRGAGGEVRQRMRYTSLQVNVGTPPPVPDGEPGAAGGEGLLPTTHLKATVDLRGFTQNWQQRYGEITDYMGVWVREERRGGGGAVHRAAFKFRKPFDLYLQWEEGGGGVAEALVRQGWNEGRIRVRARGWGGSLIGDFPAAAYAERWRGGPALEGFGIHQMVERLQGQLLRGWLREELEVKFTGVQQGYDGQPCYVLEFLFPNSQVREYRYYRIVTYWDVARRLPVKHEAYDWADRLNERTEFRHLQLNVSLSDFDFDAANPAYGFLLFPRAPRLDRFLTGRE